MSTESHAALTFTDASFEADVLKFPGVVLVDFWAAWCAPCRMVGPVVEALAAQYQDNPNVRIGKVDVDANMQISNQYRIMSIPALKVFKNGIEVDEMVGAAPQPVIEDMLKRALAA